MLTIRRSLGFLCTLLGLTLAPALVPAHAEAQSQIKPWFLFVVDTSGSMEQGAPANSCGYKPANRLNAAK